MANKASLENVLSSVMAIGNSEQNSKYPVNIFQSHYNAVTSFLLDKLSEVYPAKVDVLLPFIKTLKIPITNGYFQLPDDYRNLLGAPSVNLKPDGSDCSSDIVIDSAQEFKTANLKAGCKTRAIIIKSAEEFDDLTTSTYAYPTVFDPIGKFIGEKRIQVCPYNLPRVEITYVRKESLYAATYAPQPDDTYIIIGNSDTDWGESAFEYIFKGVLALYTAYTRDSELKDWNVILQNGIL